MYNIEADLHMHTVNSGHAYSTVDELAKTASFKGLKLIAITEHGPNLPGGPHEYFFGNMSIIPNEMYGVKNHHELCCNQIYLSRYYKFLHFFRHL